MPPRSVTRKKSTPASARVKKSTPKLKKLDVEMSPVDQNNTEFENEGQDLGAAEDIGSQQEGVSAAVKDEEDEQAATAGEEIKQEIGILDTKSTEVKGIPSVVEEKDVVSTALEARVKQEVVEEVLEERNVEDLTGDQTDVNLDSFIQGDGVADEDGERMEVVQSEVGHEENDNAYVADVTEKCDYVAEEKAAEGEQDEGRNVGKGGTQSGVVPVAEQYSCEEGAATAQIDDAEALGDNDNVLVVNEGINGEGGDQGVVKNKEDVGDSEEENMVDKEDEEHSSFIGNLITDGKKEKDLEIYIGSLDKGAVEDDLIEVFGKFGEIRAARVVRNPATNKSKGYAFIQYATVEQAKNALTALKDGIQVKGKHVKISASQDNDTLYVGNICKLWTKELVLETLKSYGIKNIEDIHLPDDSQKEGKIKGFALLEFSTHSDALAAFQRLRKPDAVFGRDRSAKVAFAQTPMHPNQEVLSQVKTVYVEGITDAWNEEKVKEICKQYGEVEKVKLSRSLGTKRKDYGFVTFTSRESALACVEGINNAHIGEGEVKVKASIAKPHFKGRLQKKGTRGDFKVKKETVPSTKEESERENKDVPTKMKVKAKSKQAKKRAKMVVEEKGKALSVPEIGGGGKPNKRQTVIEDKSVQASSRLERPNRKRKNLHSEAEGRGKIGAEHGHNEKPSKKPKGNKRGRKSNNFRKPKRDHIRNESNNGADYVRYRNPHALGYAASAISYQSPTYMAISGSKRPYADMAPHAGYLEPVARKQGRSNSGYLEPPLGMQYQPHVGYHESAVGTQSQSHTRYLEPALGAHGQPHAGYLVPAVGRQGRSHTGYLESAVAKYSHDQYDLPSRRVGEQDLHGSGQSAYGAGSSLPHSYVPKYTNYAVYEDGSSGGGHYQSSAVHLPRRAYY